MTDPGYKFAGIPVTIDPHMPENEVWVIQQGESHTIHVHEGPQSGQDVEVWLRGHRVCRLINLGPPLSRLKWPLKAGFELIPTPTPIDENKTKKDDDNDHQARS